MTDRVGFILAHQAAQEAIAKANTAELSERDHRVFLAVLASTVLWSKLDDQISLARLAELASPNGKQNREAQKRVAVSLRRLNALGVVVYTPGRGRHQVSTVALPSPEKGAASDPLIDGEKGAGSTQKRGQVGHEKGAGSTQKRGQPATPYPREPSIAKKKPRAQRDRCASSSSDSSSWEDVPEGEVAL